MNELSVDILELNEDEIKQINGNLKSKLVEKFSLLSNKLNAYETRNGQLLCQIEQLEDKILASTVWFLFIIL